MIEDAVARGRRLVDSTSLGPSTRAVTDAAKARGIPSWRLDDGSLVQLGYGIHRKLLQAAETSNTSSVSVDLSCDKARTKALLERAFLPVPRGEVFESLDLAVKFFSTLT